MDISDWPRTVNSGTVEGEESITCRSSKSHRYVQDAQTCPVRNTTYGEENQPDHLRVIRRVCVE